MGFSPCEYSSSPLKASVFFENGAEQECSGYGWGWFPGLKPRLRGGTVGGVSRAEAQATISSSYGWAAVDAGNGENVSGHCHGFDWR